MVSDFLKKKLLHAFVVFFDTDKSGSIDKDDLQAFVDKVAKILKLSPGDPKYKEIQDLVSKLWEGILSQADADKDGKVTPDEWVSMWEGFAKNPSALSEWQKIYSDLLFKILDVSNDGSINSQEFSDLFAQYGLSKDEATSAFQKTSKGKASISQSEFKELWTAYFSSDDPNAAGNFILGKASF